MARSAQADDLREQILTGYKSGKPFTPYVPTLDLPVPVDRVLDFGCGVGRSFPYLKTIAHSITGFDLPPMIERCRVLAGESVDLLTDDWAATRERRFDLIFAVLVLQHIETETCRAYLRDFARMAPNVYLLTRIDSDFGVNVLAMAAETDAFDASECVAVDHDPDTHQLRVLGRSRFEDVCRATDGGHVEVLLRSKLITSSQSLGPFDQGSTPMSEAPDAMIRRWFEELWNQGREDTIDRMLAPDAKVYGLPTPDNTPPVGPGGFKPLYRQFRGAFPDLKIKVEQSVCEGDRAAVLVTCTGTHKGDTLGVPATGRPVKFEGMVIIQVKDGRLAAGWNSFDFLTMYQQIGAVPQLGA